MDIKLKYDMMPLSFQFTAAAMTAQQHAAVRAYQNATDQRILDKAALGAVLETSIGK